MRQILQKITYPEALLLAVLFAAVTVLAGLDVRSIESGDELRVAGISAEIALEGNALVPRLNGEPFLEYPPLYYWMSAAACRIFGIHEFAVKLPSALAAIGCALLVALFARKLKYPPWAALLAAVMLCTGAQFFGNSRKCMVDALLAFFILRNIPVVPFSYLSPDTFL